MRGAHSFQGESTSQSRPREINLDDPQQPSTQTSNPPKKRKFITNKVVLEVKQLVESGLTFREIGAKLGYAAATVNRKYLEYCKFGLLKDDTPKHIGRVLTTKNDNKPLIMDLLFRDLHLSLPKIQRKLGESGTTYNICTLNNWVAGPFVNFTIKPIKTASTPTNPSSCVYDQRLCGFLQGNTTQNAKLVFLSYYHCLVEFRHFGMGSKNPQGQNKKGENGNSRTPVCSQFFGLLLCVTPSGVLSFVTKVNQATLAGFEKGISDVLAALRVLGGSKYTVCLSSEIENPVQTAKLLTTAGHIVKA